MKKRILTAVLALLLLVMIGCGNAAKETLQQTEAPRETEAEVQMSEVDTRVAGAEEYAPHIFVMIPEESVPLASEPEGITKQQAQDIAIAHAGFENGEISFLYTQYIEDAQAPYYQVDFRQDGNPYSFRVDAATGEILPE